MIGTSLVAAAALVAAPACARNPVENSRLTYVQARAAAMSGERARSAQLLASLADANANDSTIARKALTEAIAAGDMQLAMRLVRKQPTKSLTVDARLLLVADELRRGQTQQALQLLAGSPSEGSAAFVAPLLEAWNLAERRDPDGALAKLEMIPVNSLLGPFRAENRAFMLIKFGRLEEAETFARRAIGAAGAREARLRLALADAFVDAGDRGRALAMVEGMGTESAVAKARVASGRSTGQAIDTAAKAFAELLLAIAVDLNRLNDRALPVGMVQVARYADPRNSAASILLALLLDDQGRAQAALNVLQTVAPADPLSAQARDAAARILVDEKRFGEAYQLAVGATMASGASISDYARLGDVLAAMKRYDDAAAAYGRAAQMASAQGLKTELWPLHLLRATALESGNRWPEAKQALHAALAIVPEQPLVLNFLGYAKLERGEDLDAAEAMIRKASALAPDDASITDSLGWALYKRGRIDDAIETLQRAAARDPQQWEIHEHLGDALYTSGRRYEARFAWNAALITAEEDVAARIRLKLETGLNPANAAP